MNSWLQKNNMEVRVQGEMFQTNPMDLWRLNLRDLEQTGELLSKRVQVRRVNVETSFQVGIKTDREEDSAAEEAEAMRKMLAETKEEMAKLKADLQKLNNSSVAMKDDLKMRLNEKVSELNSSVTAVNVKLDEKECQLSGDVMSQKAELDNLMMKISKLENEKEEAEMAIQKLKRTYHSILLIGGENCRTSAEWFYPWDPSRNRLLTTPLSSPRQDHIGVVLDTSGKVLIASGWDGWKAISSVVLLDPITESWTPVQSMSVNRTGAAAAVVHGVVYVCGGWDGHKALDSCERFQSGVWESITPLSKARHSLTMVAVDGKLYAIGGKCFGKDNSYALSLVEA